MAAAYTLVDLSDLDPKVQKQLLEDANAGGGQYGLRVVEEVINGGARAPIYGYYHSGPDAELWDTAKKDLGITASDVDDGEVLPQQPDATDPQRAALLREQARLSANNEAERLRASAARNVADVTGEDVADVLGGDGAGVNPTHMSNIMDDTLSPDATNRAEEAGSAEEAAAASEGKTTKNKAPK